MMMMMMMMIMVPFSVRSFVVLQDYSSVGQPVLLPRVSKKEMEEPTSS